MLKLSLAGSSDVDGSSSLMLSPLTFSRAPGILKPSLMLRSQSPAEGATVQLYSPSPGS